MSKGMKGMRIVLLILVLLLIISMFLPVYARAGKITGNEATDSSLKYIFPHRISNFGLSIFSFLLPIIGAICLFVANKKAQYFAWGALATSFCINIMYCATIYSSSLLMTGLFTSGMNYKPSIGYYCILILSILIFFGMIMDIILTAIFNKASASKGGTGGNTFENSVKRLNSLKAQGLLTDEEYEEKRVDLVRDLKL